MEKLVSLAEPVGFLFLQTLLSYVIMTLLKSSPTSLSFLRSCVEFCTCLSMAHDETPAKNTRSRPRGDAQLGREDVEMVMDVMGLRRSRDGEPLREVSSDELSSLFEEKEPSLEEVKETFRVFDQNGDGFIDALELQRVLTGLGFVEGLEMDACGGMIELYDENHDGKIDFVEFVSSWTWNCARYRTHLMDTISSSPNIGEEHKIEVGVGNDDESDATSLPAFEFQMQEQGNRRKLEDRNRRQKPRGSSRIRTFKEKPTPVLNQI
ncbi:hypothetical protein C4D60_Mb10t11630 [Musa balbisiana]|uniref:EF-hand domain-containing protein n=1 Tax=Musa balbisiana TaxID=52838 RepID=A0A4V4H4R2_MUSBA|nr:hypothetical protein C4D60_Mb10t11630 [Musa balbisiana]